jgi:hypothetical protein
MQIDYRKLRQRILRIGLITALLAGMIYLVYAYSNSSRVGSGQREISRDTGSGKVTFRSDSQASQVTITIIPKLNSRLGRDAINVIWSQGEVSSSEFHAIVLVGVRNPDSKYKLTGGKLLNEKGEDLLHIPEHFLIWFELEFADIVVSELSEEGENKIKQDQ